MALRKRGYIKWLTHAERMTSMWVMTCSECPTEPTNYGLIQDRQKSSELVWHDLSDWPSIASRHSAHPPRLTNLIFHIFSARGRAWSGDGIVAGRRHSWHLVIPGAIIVLTTTTYSARPQLSHLGPHRTNRTDGPTDGRTDVRLVMHHRALTERTWSSGDVTTCRL